MEWKTFLESYCQPADTSGSAAWVRFLADIPAEPTVLWYPSAGDDFKDTRYLSAEAEAQYFRAGQPQVFPGQVEAFQESEVPAGWAAYPDFFVHTDVLPASSWSPLDTADHLGHSLIIEQRIPLQVSEQIPWEASPRFVHIAPKAPPAGRQFAELLLIRPSDPAGDFPLQPVPVVYFYMENFNFLRDVLLAFRLPAHWVLQINFGEEIGGAATPPSYLQLFFGYLRTRYLLAQSHYLDKTEEDREETRQFLAKFLKWRPEMWDYFRAKENHAISAEGQGHIAAPLWDDNEPVHLLALTPKTSLTDSDATGETEARQEP
jgi:hypothetical protein